MAAGDLIFVLSAQCNQDPHQLLCLVKLLIAAQEHVASSLSSTSSEYFKLLARLLSHAINSNIQVLDMSAILDQELQWIQGVQVSVCMHIWAMYTSTHRPLSSNSIPTLSCTEDV